MSVLSHYFSHVIGHFACCSTATSMESLLSVVSCDRGQPQKVDWCSAVLPDKAGAVIPYHYIVGTESGLKSRSVPELDVSSAPAEARLRASPFLRMPFFEDPCITALWPVEKEAAAR